MYILTFLQRYNSFLLACLMGHCNALRAILDAAEKLSSMSLSALPHTPIAQPTFSSRSSPCLPSINENARDAALLSPVSTKAPSSPEKEKTLRPSLFLWRRRLLLSSRASSATSCSSPLEMAIVSRDLASVELLMSLSDEECILVVCYLCIESSVIVLMSMFRRPLNQLLAFPHAGKIWNQRYSDLHSDYTA